MTALPRKEGANRGNAGKGRPKGVPNKTTRSAREAMELAFQGLGGVPKLTEWAKDNPTEFYRLWGRLIPAEVQHASDPAHPMTLEVVFRNEASR